jgi:hypothetical protein
MRGIKAKLERSGRPDPTARATNPPDRAQHAGRGRAQVPGRRSRRGADRTRWGCWTRSRRWARLGRAAPPWAQPSSACSEPCEGTSWCRAARGSTGRVRNLAARNVQVEVLRGRALRARVRLESRNNMQIGTAAAQLGGADIEFAATDDDDQLDPVAWIVRVERERIDRRADAPLFQRDDGSALTRGEVESLVRVAAGVVGEPQDRLTMHSGRAGMTTLLATAGFDAAFHQGVRLLAHGSVRGLHPWDGVRQASPAAVLRAQPQHPSGGGAEAARRSRVIAREWASSSRGRTERRANAGIGLARATLAYRPATPAGGGRAWPTC